MTIFEIQQHLKTTPFNGVYIRRPHFSKLKIEIYLDKENNVWEVSVNNLIQVDFMKFELEIDDWEIV